MLYTEEEKQEEQYFLFIIHPSLSHHPSLPLSSTPDSNTPVPQILPTTDPTYRTAHQTSTGLHAFMDSELLNGFFFVLVFPLSFCLSRV